MKQVLLSLGSNIPDRLSYLKKAIFYLSGSGLLSIDKLSSVYLTRPLDMARSRYFLNACIWGRSSADPLGLLILAQGIEKEIGRKTRSKNESREIDIDILFYEDTILETKELKIPHPGMRERLFVLLPACEIAPDFIHPVFKKSVRDMAGERLRLTPQVRREVRKVNVLW